MVRGLRGRSQLREKTGGMGGGWDMPTYVYHPLSTERAKRCVNQNRLKRMYPFLNSFNDRGEKKKTLRPKTITEGCDILHDHIKMFIIVSIAIIVLKTGIGHRLHKFLD